MSILFLTPTHAAEVTPSDTAPNDCVGFYVGSGGDIAVTTEGGDDVTFRNTVAGSIISIRVHIIKSTGTTASNIIRMWS